jgi:hypothetical protein
MQNNAGDTPASTNCKENEGYNLHPFIATASGEARESDAALAWDYISPCMVSVSVLA